jgi:hypothetical protein
MGSNQHIQDTKIQNVQLKLGTGCYDSADHFADIPEICIGHRSGVPLTH